MKVSVHARFKPLQLVAGVAFRKGGIEVNLPPYVKRRTDYMVAVMMWPLQLNITLMTGDVDALARDFGA